MRPATLNERRALAAFRQHHGKPKLVCPCCGKKFSGASKLAKHAVEKHEVKQ